jgi:hypothetical protein
MKRKNQNITTTRKLVLDKQTLRELKPSELTRGTGGGLAPKDTDGGSLCLCNC